MKAIVQDTYGSVDRLELRDVDMPSAGKDDVLIRVHAAGVDPSVLHLMTGLPYPVRLHSGLRAPKNRVGGQDVAGTVEAVGTNVTRFQPGDEVFGTCTGAFAEYAVARHGKLAPKPANLTFDQAAAVPISASTALQALRDAGRVQPDQHVLIIGAAGGIGTFAVQLAKSFGATVTAVCGTAKTDLVTSLGADHVIDYTLHDFADGATRYDLILDTAGNRALRHLRKALTPKGTLVVVGGETGGRWLQGTDRQLRAALLSPFVRHRLRGLLSLPHLEKLEFLTPLLESGELVPVIDRTYALSATADAITYLAGGHARGKILVTP
jgi:NADPH:quinone reductase-like Zn-dependent oxidoreductase